MSATTLHYFYDPLCGWCYGAAPLVKAAREVLPVIPHGGGMMTGARRQPVTAQLRDFVKPHDARIAQLSGQPFGEGYRDGLLHDTEAVFDSEPPTAAMLAAEALAGRGLDMLAQLQIAHYVEGRRIADRAVLIEVAASLGLEAESFAVALDHQSGEAVQAHIQQTRAFMAQMAAQGFPSFVLETGGVFKRLDVASYLGRAQDFQTLLRNQIHSATAPATGEAFGCDADGCAL
ncbi:DsbA family protein [Uliginosibacterium sp. TH139]|uniref:DsbA family protein n=1 Tax=Uliginosibacterium sp. TH139 TaxID=2067453 RepID=UPI000C7B2DDE|nr:DsbA family protein [Uliginosibacterium sp. TH139]PLK48036.1 protein-disulfide isomerase [Uliginosibacterium sp. TH139]